MWSSFLVLVILSVELESFFFFFSSCVFVPFVLQATWLATSATINLGWCRLTVAQNWWVRQLQLPQLRQLQLPQLRQLTKFRWTGRTSPNSSRRNSPARPLTKPWGTPLMCTPKNQSYVVVLKVKENTPCPTSTQQSNKPTANSLISKWSQLKGKSYVTVSVFCTSQAQLCSE